MADRQPYKDRINAEVQTLVAFAGVYLKSDDFETSWLRAVWNREKGKIKSSTPKPL